MRTITVLTPLREDTGAIAGRLAEWNHGASPFSRSDRTHFARVVVVPESPRRHERPRGMRRYARLIDLLAHGGRPQREDSLGRSYLAFSAVYDEDPPSPRTGGHDPYLDHLCRRLGPVADDLWGGCDGYPGSGDAARLAAYLSAHTVPPAYEFTPAETATVAETRRALRLRRTVIGLAVATQHATDTEIRARFDEAFGPGADHDLDPDPDSASKVAGDLRADEWNRSAEQEALEYLRRPRVAPSTHPPDLTDVQGLTVGYRAHHAAALVCWQITDAAAARAWLASTPVTTATDAIAAAATGSLPVARHIAVSHRGMIRLGVPAVDRDGFDRAFRAGMARREHVLAPGLGTTTWRAPYRPDRAPDEPTIDLLVHTSAADGDTLATALADLRAEIAAAGGLMELACEEGHRLPGPAAPQDGRRRFTEHFGFADGLSQPIIAGLRQPGATVSMPGVFPTGELLLGYRDVDGDTAGATAPARLTRNGCYLVFRKLEQDVEGFRALIADGGLDAAKLVGRHRDGLPLAERVSPGAPFTFARDPEGARCPIGAHVRRTNPRDSRPLLTDADSIRRNGSGIKPGPGRNPIEPRLNRRHRMVRRGIPYGRPLPAGGERGLLFVALVGDVGRQYEFVQTQWMNSGQAFRLGTDPDVISGVAGPGRKLTVQGDPPAFVEFPKPLVTCRGGEYFLMPGVAALRTMATHPSSP